MILTLLERLSGLDHWQIDLIATTLLLQGAVVAVFPEEVVITGLGILWSQGKVGFVEALLAVQLGLLPANWCLVFFGKRFGARLIAKKPFSWIIDPVGVEHALDKLALHENGVIFLTRFTPLIRGPMYFAIGISKIRRIKFMLIDAAASYLQIPILLFLGKELGAASQSVTDAYLKLGKYSVLIALGLIVLSLIRKKMLAHKKN